MVAIGSWENFERAAIDRSKHPVTPVETLIFAGFKNVRFDLDESIGAHIVDIMDLVDTEKDKHVREGRIILQNIQDIQKRDRAIPVPHAVQGLVSEVESRIAEFYKGMMVEMVHTPFRNPPASMQTTEYRPWYRAMISVGYCTAGENPYIGNIEFILLFGDIKSTEDKKIVKSKVGIAAQLPVIAASQTRNSPDSQQKGRSEHFVSQTDNALRYLWDKLDEVSELEKGVYIAFKPSSGNVQGKSENAVYLANRAYKIAFRGNYNFNPSAEIRTEDRDMQTKPKSAQAPRGSVIISDLKNYIAQSGKKTII